MEAEQIDRVLLVAKDGDLLRRHVEAISGACRCCGVIRATEESSSAHGSCSDTRSSVA